MNAYNKKGMQRQTKTSMGPESTTVQPCMTPESRAHQQMGWPFGNGAKEW